MDYFINPIKNHYMDFEGKVKRKPFWMFTLINFILMIAIYAIGIAAGFPLLGTIYSLVLFLPSIAITTRRLHDTSRSGWWQLISLIPLIGPIILIVFLVQDSK